MTSEGPPVAEGVQGVVAYIGVGANLGDPLAQCRQGLRLLGEVPGVRLLRRSSWYRTEPVGPADQPWFINAVAEIRTSLSPRELLEAVKAIEERMGRRTAAHWGPRAIDLDLLLYGQTVLEEPGLIVPHPELHRRRFVLEPLGEVASWVMHPAFGVSIRGLLDRLADPGVVERLPDQGAGD
jgi:2-amino-4-hydroxy-6-hydroxymethyldihydropteridine diphosphokinase